MAQHQGKIAQSEDERDINVATIMETQAQNLEGHTKFIMQEQASYDNRSHLRGRGYGIGMFLQIYADDLVFVQLEDVTLKS